VITYGIKLTIQLSLSRLPIGVELLTVATGGKRNFGVVIILDFFFSGELVVTACG